MVCISAADAMYIADCQYVIRFFVFRLVRLGRFLADLGLGGAVLSGRGRSEGDFFRRRFVLIFRLLLWRFEKKMKKSLACLKKSSIFATSNQENESCLTSCKKPM